MRNKIFGILAIASVMVACSNDETISIVSSEPITFGNTFVENSTRAVMDNTYGGGIYSLTKFNVYGTVTSNDGTVNIYNGDEVTGTIGSSIWSCEKVQYWVPNCIYNFMALVDATESENSVTVDQATGMPTSITYDVTSQKDLLIAKANREQKDKELDDSEVAFTFSHLLSKVQFTFTNHFPENSDVKLKVKELKITNAPQTGTYTIGSDNNNSWTMGTVTGEINFGNSEEISPAGTGTSEYAKVLIPGTNTFNISFTVAHNKGGEPTPKSFTTGAITLESGKSYNFTADLNAQNVSGVAPITFKITEDDDWTGGEDKNVDY
ncbi:MAG: fimbrillin family protein [Bacteroidaceae bacterium]|nr:fimbrillin family protein [Bacteroidaceae bacterium]